MDLQKIDRVGGGIRRISAAPLVRAAALIGCISNWHGAGASGLAASGGMRLWQFPFSTNVERVALALAHKGLDAEPVVIDPADRSGVRARSGQDLVPVLEHDGELLSGSLDIVAHLEDRFPDRPLVPAQPARAEEARVFCDWFDRVWKIAPNALADAIDAGRDADEPELTAWATELRGSLDRFEALLAGRDHLLGHEFGIVDVAVFPFLRYGVGLHDEDVETFHRILAEHLRLEPRHARLRLWIERVDARPRAGLAPGFRRRQRNGRVLGAF